MTIYKQLFEEAIGNYGIVTTKRAREMGIPIIELVKLAHRGRLMRIGYGAYKLVEYAPAADGRDMYANALAKVGEGAYLFGPSVLAFYGLCPTDPAHVYVGLPTKCRRKIEKAITVLDNRPCEESAWHEGLCGQSVLAAIRSSEAMIMSDRLAAAVSEARRRGLIRKGSRI